MRFVLFFSVILFITSCSVFKKTAIDPDEIAMTVDLDTVNIYSGRTAYIETPAINSRLLHTRLKVDFDWENRRLNGEATLRFTPHFYNQDKLVLDAKAFDIIEVKLLENDVKTNLDYAYDSLELTISFDRTYSRNDTFEVFIKYTANPYSQDFLKDGAIRGARGLYFVNHDGKTEGRPRQIWTQGQTESNSFWFPTKDKPNQRTTSEIYMTVNDSFKTLSNGELYYSEMVGDGMRTDYWRQDISHPPYLMMMAVGEYAIVSDTWRDLDVDYYVYPEFEEHARAIFGNTPEMMEFFSELFGVDYPWEKYAQVIVHDFVAGAMENTSASVYMDLVQRTETELKDRNFERIIAHELAHHWFGNYVTCESWSNLVLNEGFATYSEYLWADYKYGKERSQYKLHFNRRAYLSEARSRINSLIRFQYNDPLEMFDRHSYQKGGLVLHMLRNKIGDEAFFLGLQEYLTKNALEAVEVHHLRLALEDVSGIDLNRFFNQWFLSAGHPVLDVNYAFDTTSRQLNIKINQIQNFENDIPVFHFPITFKVLTTENEWLEKTFNVKKMYHDFDWELESEPKLILADPEQILLAEILEKGKSESQLYEQLKSSEHFFHRLNAFDSLLASVQDIKTSRTVFREISKTLDDKHWYIRNQAIERIPLTELENLKSSFKNKLIDLYNNDPENRVRAAALERIFKDFGDRETISMLGDLMNVESYMVKAVALRNLYDFNAETAIDFVLNNLETNNPDLISAIGEVLSKSFIPEAQIFFQRNLNRLSFRSQGSLLASYNKYLLGSSFARVRAAMPQIENIITESEGSRTRVRAAELLRDLRDINRKRITGEEIKDDAPFKDVKISMEDSEQIVELVSNVIENIRLKTDNRRILNILRN